MTEFLYNKIDQPSGELIHLEASQLELTAKQEVYAFRDFIKNNF